MLTLSIVAIMVLSVLGHTTAASFEVSVSPNLSVMASMNASILAGLFAMLLAKRVLSSRVERASPCGITSVEQLLLGGMSACRRVASILLPS